MSTYQHRETVESPTGAASAVTRSHRFSPGQLLGGAAGIVLVVVGIIAVTRTGIDSSLNRPITDIAGLSQSALVGLIEIGAGLIIVLSAASIAYRGVMGTFGALLVVAGIITAAANFKMSLDLGADHATGWFVAILGAVAVVGSLLPSFLRTERVVASSEPAIRA